MTAFTFNQTLTPTDEDLAEFVKFIESCKLTVSGDEDEWKVEATTPDDKYVIIDDNDTTGSVKIVKNENGKLLAFCLLIDLDEQTISVARAVFEEDTDRLCADEDHGFVVIENDIDWSDFAAETDEADELDTDNIEDVEEEV